MAKLQEVLGAIHRVTGQEPKRSGKNYKALCPAHEDTHPSLVVGETANGHATLKCMSGCDTSAVLAALGLSLNGHSNNGHNPIPKKGQLAKKAATAVATVSTPAPAAEDKPEKKRIVASYSYTDEKGKHLYSKIRFKPKSFAIKNYKDEWSLGDVSPVLYNLPLLVDEELKELPIFIVEGEKDADTIGHFFNCLATCSFDGGGKGKWRAEYNKYFTGRVVYIIPDNDNPGRDYAAEVARALAPLVKELKIINLPGLPEKGDFSDWFNLNWSNLYFNPDLFWELVDNTKAEDKPADYNTENPKTIDYRKAIRHLGYNLALNRLDNHIEVNGRHIDDILDAHIKSKLRDIGLKGEKAAGYAILIEADENGYHPIRQYLDNLPEWEGEDHINNFVQCYLQEGTVAEGKKVEFATTVLTRWFIGAVAKAYLNGSDKGGTRNFMMVWDGPQHIGKSFLARWLCPLPDYFVEGPINPEDKDCQLRLCNKWIWEVAEVDATTKRADVAALKDFISRQEQTVRRAYGKYDMTKPALASMIGTINSDGGGFLRDTTGNTRFVTFKIEKIDHSYAQQVDINQLWSQAVGMFKAGEPWHLTKEEQALRDLINAEYEVEDYIELLLKDLFVIDPSTSDYVTVSTLMKELETAGLKGSQQVNLKQLKMILTRLGCRHFRAAGEGRPVAYRGIKAKSLELA